MKIFLSILALILLATTACGDSARQTSNGSSSTPACTSNTIRIPMPTGGSLYFDATPVTVEAYEKFVLATAYQTEAEAFGNSGVFDYETKAWTLAEGATFRRPLGANTPPAPNNHPATQVSYRDAKAYCAHYGKRLPTGEEWSAAARFNMPASATLYPWGDDIRDIDGQYRANVWQGVFPHTRKVEDGFATTSPVTAFSAAPSGLYDMAGNVWEWTQDSLPQAGVQGDGLHRIARGGSFLCEPGWCHGYTVSGSTHTSEETGLFHTGFRCVCEGAD